MSGQPEIHELQNRLCIAGSGRQMFFCLHIPRPTIRFEYHRMSAAATAALLIVMGMHLDRHFLFAVGTVTCFGAALFVVVVNIILLNGNLIYSASSPLEAPAPVPYPYPMDQFPAGAAVRAVHHAHPAETEELHLLLFYRCPNKSVRLSYLPH